MLVSRDARTFSGTPDQVTLARSKVWDYLSHCPVADDACLVVTEFASNAVLHSFCGSWGPSRVCANAATVVSASYRSGTCADRGSLTALTSSSPGAPGLTAATLASCPHHPRAASASASIWAVSAFSCLAST